MAVSMAIKLQAAGGFVNLASLKGLSDAEIIRMAEDGQRKPATGNQSDAPATKPVRLEFDGNQCSYKDNFKSVTFTYTDQEAVIAKARQRAREQQTDLIVVEPFTDHVLMHESYK